jgi:hypothetical protein
MTAHEPAVMARQHPNIGVVAAAGRKADHQRHALAAEKIGDRIRARRSRHGRHAQRDEAQAAEPSVRPR